MAGDAGTDRSVSTVRSDNDGRDFRGKRALVSRASFNPANASCCSVLGSSSLTAWSRRMLDEDFRKRMS